MISQKREETRQKLLKMTAHESTCWAFYLLKTGQIDKTTYMEIIDMILGMTDNMFATIIADTTEDPIQASIDFFEGEEVK